MWWVANNLASWMDRICVGTALLDGILPYDDMLVLGRHYYQSIIFISLHYVTCTFRLVVLYKPTL
uniref:Uncharacterized protein n=1 Tax=Picea glauca TaxID=3330 RepID=A0A124GMR0_PICGL|nr:hypothetical protein ABT39_MTgene1548 [Picea glauca]